LTRALASRAFTALSVDLQALADAAVAQAARHQPKNADLPRGHRILPGPRREPSGQGGR